VASVYPGSRAARKVVSDGMLDLGVILQAPMQDKDWLKKCALMGVFAVFIPIIGALNALGWMRSYAEARLRGESELPEANLGYIGVGWRVFLMFLPVAGVIIALYVVIAIFIGIGAATKIDAIAAIGGILGTLLMIPVILWMAVFQPAMLYLHIVHGEAWASMRFKEQWALAMKAGTEYLLLWVAFLLCGVIMNAGMIACGVGLIVSMTYGYAMQGAAIAEFAKIAKTKGV
jgi:hypothetical protein